MSGIHYIEGQFSMPRVFYFQTVMTLFQGLDGHASYREFGVDARYLRLRAKAAHIMATYEKWTLYGKPMKNYAVKIVSPVPNLVGKEILFPRSYEYENRQVIALGNDYQYPIFVELKIDGLKKTPTWLVDRINGKVYGGKKGYSTRDMTEGVLIDVPHKEFRIFEVHGDLKGLDIEKVETADQKTVEGALEKSKPKLVKEARFLESFFE